MNVECTTEWAKQLCAEPVTVGELVLSKGRDNHVRLRRERLRLLRLRTFWGCATSSRAMDRDQANPYKRNPAGTPGSGGNGCLYTTRFGKPYREGAYEGRYADRQAHSPLLLWVVAAVAAFGCFAENQYSLAFACIYGRAVFRGPALGNSLMRGATTERHPADFRKRHQKTKHHVLPSAANVAILNGRRAASAAGTHRPWASPRRF